MVPDSSAQLSHYDGGGNDDRVKLDLGFTSPLIDNISMFKAKFRKWAECEKSKADLRAESFHDSLIGEQAIIDSQVKKLVSIQRDRGMNINNCIDDDDRRGRNKETVDDENNDQQKKTTTTKYFKGIVGSSFNIPYQKTGIDSLSSLDENELKRSTRGFFLIPMAREK